jgi:hypothetical protein
MTDRPLGPNPVRTRRSRAILPAVLALVAACPVPAAAGSIQSFFHDPGRQVQNGLKSLEHDVKRGLKIGNHGNTSGLPSLSSLTNLDGTLKQNVLTQYLQWKRELSPQQFDQRHPKLGALLQQSSATTTPTPAAPTASSSAPALEMLALTPGTTATAGPKAAHVVTAQEDLAPATVPEPPALVSTLALFGQAAAWRRRRGRTIRSL